MKVINRKMPAGEAIKEYEGHFVVFDGIAGRLFRNPAQLNGYVCGIEYGKHGDDLKGYFRAFKADTEITVIILEGW